MYCVVYIAPENAPDWEPDSEFVKSLFRYLKVTNIECLTAYPTPNFWDDEDDYNEEYVNESVSIVYSDDKELNDETINVDAALELWEGSSDIYHDFRPDGSDGSWGWELGKSLEEEIDQSLSEGYVPWDLSVSVGPQSISDLDCERTWVKSCVSISIGGDWCPSDQKEYIRQLYRNEHIRNLLSFLKKDSGFEWGVYFIIT